MRTVPAAERIVRSRRRALPGRRRTPATASETVTTGSRCRGAATRRDRHRIPSAVNRGPVAERMPRSATRGNACSGRSRRHDTSTERGITESPAPRGDAAGADERPTRQQRRPSRSGSCPRRFSARLRDQIMSTVPQCHDDPRTRRGLADDAGQHGERHSPANPSTYQCAAKPDSLAARRNNVSWAGALDAHRDGERNGATPQIANSTCTLNGPAASSTRRP